MQSILPSFRHLVGGCAALAATVGFALPVAAQDRRADIVDTAVAAGSFETLVAAVKAAGLVDTLKGRGPFTVFAPTDEAFAKLPRKTLESLLDPANKDALTAILTYHVVPGRVLAKDTFGLDGAPTVNGQRLGIDLGAKGLRIDDAKVVQADIACTNGVIHVVDTVLMPSDQTIPELAAAAGSFHTLVAAVKAAGLADVLSGPGPFTVFAPTDAAFKALPKGTLESLLEPKNREQLAAILKLHVVSGRVFAADAVRGGKAPTLLGQDLPITIGAKGVQVGEARLVQADINAKNGVVHVIDQVLLPASLSSRDVIAMLEKSITDGVRRFNSGQYAECVRVYERACKEIVASAGAGVDATAVRILELTLARSAIQHDTKERSWVLRHGIDLAYDALQSRGSLAGSH